jgi:hypothetical protein
MALVRSGKTGDPYRMVMPDHLRSYEGDEEWRY